MESKVYTTTEIASILSVTPNTVRRWIKEKRLSAVKLFNRQLRIEESELKRFIKENSKK
jgi:excisionase family DNA binding protein